VGQKDAGRWVNDLVQTDFLLEAKKAALGCFSRKG
jgi:hypothetical protein